MKKDKGFTSRQIAYGFQVPPWLVDPENIKKTRREVWRYRFNKVWWWWKNNNA